MWSLCSPQWEAADMEERYLRNVPALSEEECALLKTKQVLIVGCGGLGGHLIDMLLRIGVGTIRVCDGDVFELSNLNRQLLSEIALMGLNKARVAAIRGSRVNPDVIMEVHETRMDTDNVFDLIRGCDVILDALDNIESRLILASACSQAGKPYIFGAISGWVAQAAISMPGDRLVEMLYPEGTVLRDKSVLSFTPALCASVQSALCIKLLTGRPVETGKIYYFDLWNQEFETISLV